MPRWGRYGGCCLSALLHAPRSPRTCTAVDVCSNTYHTAAHAFVQSLFLCRAVMISGTCVLVQVQQCSDSIFLRFFAIRWSEQPVSERPPFQALHPQSWSSEPVNLPGLQKAAVWGGRRTTARPRGAKWSSRVAAFFFVMLSQNIFTDPFGHRYYH